MLSSHCEAEPCHGQQTIINLNQVPGQPSGEEYAHQRLPDADPLQVAMGRQLAQERGMQTISVLGLTKTGYVVLIKFEKPVGYVQEQYFLQVITILLE